MKNVKVIKKAAIFLMVFVLAFSSLSAAAAVTYSGKRVRYTGSSYKVYYNSKRVNSVTRPGLMVNGNIMIPYSYTMVKRGPKVSYSKQNKGKVLTLSYNGNKIVLYLNKTYAYINGKKEKIRTAPFKAKVGGTGLIMVPAKVVCEALDRHQLYI